MTLLHSVGTRILYGENPFSVPDEYDYFLGPKPDVPLWNETWFFSCWSPQEGVGIFIHAGADAADPGLFYAQVIGYLPNGMVIADRQWARPVAGHLTVCGFSITTEEPLRRWRLRYDGAGEKATSDETGLGPIGAGIALPFSFDIAFSGAAPVWDMYQAAEIPQLDWAGMHHEQTITGQGHITVDKQTWKFDDAVGFRDHSTGKRDFHTTGEDRFWGIVSPTTKRSFQGLKFWNREGHLLFSSGAFHTGTEWEIINGDIEITGIEDTLGNPKQLEMSFIRPDGERIVAHGEVLHTITITIDDPNNNANGAILVGDPIILAESQVRINWPDGDVFYGHLERVRRLTKLRRP